MHSFAAVSDLRMLRFSIQELLQDKLEFSASFTHQLFDCELSQLFLRIPGVFLSKNLIRILLLVCLAIERLLNGRSPEPSQNALTVLVLRNISGGFKTSLKKALNRQNPSNHLYFKKFKSLIGFKKFFEQFFFS